jgi:hypothetical protein
VELLAPLVQPEHGGFRVKAETVPIDSLSFDPANVRKHGERNLATIKASLQRFGQQKPIVVDANGVVRPAKVHHAQVGDDLFQRDAAVIAASDTFGRVVANARHHIDFTFNKDARRVRREEEAVRVIDGVARETANTKHLRLGLLVCPAELGEVDLPKAVNLRWRDHRMATPGPHRAVKEAREWQIAGLLAVTIGPRPQRHWLFNQIAFAIGHHQFRRVR